MTPVGERADDVAEVDCGRVGSMIAWACPDHNRPRCRPPDDLPSAASPRSSARCACSTRSCRFPATPAPRAGAAHRDQRLHGLAHALDAGRRRLRRARAAETGRYRLGTHLLALSNHVLAGLDLRAVARPHLVELETETGETATLSVPGERDAVTVDFVSQPRVGGERRAVGRPSIAHATATGKVGLAFGAGRPAEAAARAATPTARSPTRGARPEVDAVRAAGLGAGRRRARARPERDRRARSSAPAALAAILGLQGPAAASTPPPRTPPCRRCSRHAAAVSQRPSGMEGPPAESMVSAERRDLGRARAF